MRKVTRLAPLLVAGMTVAPAAHAQGPEVVPSPATTQPPPPPPPDFQPPVAAKGSPIAVSYDGGTIFRAADGTFELKLNGLMQARYELLRVPEDAEGEAETLQRFLLRRTRISMEGFAFTRSVTYKMEASFGDDGTPRLRDFYTNVAILDQRLQFRFGQWKRPYNRQEIVSDFATELPEKAVTNVFAGGARDIGVALHNGYDKSPDGLEWVVAFMNGSVTAADFEPEIIARLGVNVGGIRGYSEGDLEGGPLRLAAAINYRLANLDNGPLTHHAGVDMMLKVNGVSLQAAGFVQKAEDEDATFAAHVQAGFFITPRAAQIAARFALIPSLSGAEDEYLMEVRGAFNHYWFGHNLKLSSDVGVLDDTTDGSDAQLQLRIQGQLIF